MYVHTYLIGEEIGRGGMADVRLALQQGAGGFERLVVVKRVAPWARQSDEYTRSFMIEARVAASMSHPNIVTTLDVGEDEEGPYLVLEYVSGETLSFVLDRLRKAERPMPVPLACRIAASVGRALEFVHSVALPDGTPWRVVHRDVSPSNVMCGYSGRVKLLDFGVAKVDRDDPTIAGVVKGKPRYMAPEQVLGLPIDERGDIYQLGIVFWEMLTGHRLFPSSPEALVQLQQGIVERPRNVAHRVPKELDDLVMWMLRYDVEDRCPSARAFVEQLQGYAPKLFGTSEEQHLATFMMATFADQYEARRSVERRTRELATADVTDPSVSRTLTPAPRIVRTGSYTVPQPPTAAPSRERAWTVWGVGLSTAVIVAALVIGVGSTLLPGPTPETPEPELAIDDRPERAPAPDAPPVEPPTEGALPDEPAPAPVVTPTEPRPRPRSRSRSTTRAAAEIVEGSPAAEMRDEPAPLPVETREPAPPPEPPPPKKRQQIEEVSDNLNPWSKP